MSEKYLPFTDEERTFRVEGARQSVGMPGSAGILRWDATLRQLEEGLAAVTAERDVEWNARGEAERERDAYRWVVLELLDDKTLAEFIATVEQCGWGELREGRILDAVRGLGSLVIRPPSGSPGGFAAAAGIPADTWDGEPSEDAIRRLRDGAPLGSECDLGSCAQCALQDTGACNDTVRQSAPPATTKTISETRMGEPNAIDAVEEET